MLETQTTTEERLDTFLRFGSLLDDGLTHGISTRAGGVSSAPFDSLNLSLKTGDEEAAVEQNRHRFERLAGIGAGRVACGRLTHGNEVTVFKIGGLIEGLARSAAGWMLFEADAAISDVPGLVLVMTFADCVPILLWDPVHRACALAHAGWRGTALRIGSVTVGAMAREFETNPAQTRAAIGPAIGPCCYQVGEDVHRSMKEGYGEEGEGFIRREKLDLTAANQFDLLSAGILEENVQLSGLCTACNTDRFFSHRAEAGITGRFGACIGIAASWVG